jgi:hypothetical protein
MNNFNMITRSVIEFVRVIIVRTTDTAKMIGLIGSEDKEGAVEEDLDEIDSMYDVADAGDRGKPEIADDEHLETGESTDQEKNVF